MKLLLILRENEQGQEPRSVQLPLLHTECWAFLQFIFSSHLLVPALDPLQLIFWETLPLEFDLPDFNLSEWDITNLGSGSWSQQEVSVP